MIFLPQAIWTTSSVIQTSYVLGLDDFPGTSVMGWVAPQKERGFIYEAMQGGNLPATFPTIDKFSKGTATSVKSIDLTTASYTNNLPTLKTTLKGYVDKLDGFETATRKGVTIKAEDITEKVLNIGIPHKVTGAQQKILNEIKAYGKEKGINVVYKKVK